MAPELVRGDRDITPSADVFSLGCVMFHCLTGRAVFEADESTALLAKSCCRTRPACATWRLAFLAALDECMARMLAKNPAQRLADAQTVLGELDALAPLGKRAAPAGAARGHRARPGADGRRAAHRLRRDRRAVGHGRAALERPDAAAATPSGRGGRGGGHAGQLRRCRCSRTSWRGCTGRGFNGLPDGSVVVSLPDGSGPPIRRPRRRAVRWPCGAPARRAARGFDRGGALLGLVGGGRGDRQRHAAAARTRRGRSGSTTWPPGCSTRASTSAATGRPRSCAASATCSSRTKSTGQDHGVRRPRPRDVDAHQPLRRHGGRVGRPRWL